MNVDDLKMARNRLICGNTAHSCKAGYMKLAVACIEKQIPEKVVYNADFDLYACPLCGDFVAWKRFKGLRKYCDCGQCLDWEGVK